MDDSIEYQKIINLLQIKTNEFEFLKKLSAQELKQLRIKTAEVIDIDQADIWKRIANVSKFMPNFINAKVGETVLGPMLSANLSYYIPVKDGVAVLKNMSIPFLAEVSDYMIPEKAVTLINEIPVDILKKVTNQLLQQKKYFTASNFVNILPLDKILTISEIITNEFDLIAIAEYVENKSYIAKIVERFNDAKVQKIISTAYSNDKQEVVLSVLEYLSSAELKRVIKVVNQLPISVQTVIIKDIELRIK